VYEDLATNTSVKVPTQIGSDTDWSTVETSPSNGSMSCATKTDGSLWCWGSGAKPVPGIVTTPLAVH
jgi:hypothetical protein